MKRLFSLLLLLNWAVIALAQTPLEILSRMEEEMQSHSGEGLAMIVDTKIPVLGTTSVQSYTLGQKIRIETKLMGVQVISWSDSNTSWDYNSKTKEVVITGEISTDDETGDTELFMGIAEGYDVSIAKETAKEWHLLCKKSKSNTEEDAPKKMELVVAKGTYHPISLKASISGITMTMRDIVYGVDESQVTFNREELPEETTIVDKR